MLPSGFKRLRNFTLIPKFSKKYHRLASTASNLKDAKIQLEILYVMILTKNICFSKHQNEGEFRNLGDSAVISIL